MVPHHIVLYMSNVPISLVTRIEKQAVQVVQAAKQAPGSDVVHFPAQHHGFTVRPDPSHEVMIPADIPCRVPARGLTGRLRQSF